MRNRIMQKRRMSIYQLCLAGALCTTGAYAYAPNQTMDEATARAMLNRFGFGADSASLAQAMHQTPEQYVRDSITGDTQLPASIVSQIEQLPTSQPVDQIWHEYGAGSDMRLELKSLRQATANQPVSASTVAPAGAASSPADAANAADVLARQMEQQAIQKAQNEYLNAAIKTRMLTMANSSNQGHESLLTFWLNHFSIYGPKNTDRLLAMDYARALESAMKADTFEALLKASFYHAAMQVYLDNAQSTSPQSTIGYTAALKGKNIGINENLARELMELHTLGVDGGYSQTDVQELARIITGAGIYNVQMQDKNLKAAGATRKGLFLFDPRRHDFGTKMFLGQVFPAGQGLDEIDRALHILATHPATAHHIAFKLARQYLADDPSPALVNAMTAAYLKSGGKISATLQPLLASPEFAASLQHPVKFKDPLSYMLSATRAACSGQPIGNANFLANTARDMGEAPFMQSTPNGYGATEADWLSPVSMAQRTRLAQALATGRAPAVAAPVMAPAPSDSGVMAVNPAGNMSPPSPVISKGIGCSPNLPLITRLVGPLSSQTAQAANGLSPQDHMALLLASPEFMKR